MEALILFADLDHLKEINDVFGHAEGDFAIKYCGEKDLLIAEEMKAADLALYEVKKRRRESVRKQHLSHHRKTGVARLFFDSTTPVFLLLICSENSLWDHSFFFFTKWQIVVFTFSISKGFAR